MRAKALHVWRPGPIRGTLRQGGILACAGDHRPPVGILGASAGLAPAVEHHAEGRVDPSRLAAVTIGLEHAPDVLAGRVSTGSGTKVHIDPYA
jgi:hypothetical protein